MGNPQYTSVTETADCVAIVATGSSLKDVELKFHPDVKVIAVNAAIYYQKRCDFWFTLDPSPSNCEIMKTRFKGVTYYAAVPETFRTVSDHIKYLRRVTGNGHGRFLTKAGLSPDKRAIHTGNSAFGALQLAAHMRPRRIALFGVDGFGSYHYGGSPRNLDMVPALFESTVHGLNERGIQVVNGSPRSVVTCFHRMKPLEAVEWLRF